MGRVSAFPPASSSEHNSDRLFVCFCFRWCNVNNAGFGTRPTSSSGVSNVDAIVWIKPGGEGDGTSNTSAVRYDLHCGVDTAKKPAPEAGTWFQVSNAGLSWHSSLTVPVGVLRDARQEREPCFVKGPRVLPHSFVVLSICNHYSPSQSKCMMKRGRSPSEDHEALINL